MEVLEDKMMKPFATLISCRDTIGSECVRGTTLDDCVRQCRDNPFCACGYFLQPSDPKQPSYCVPLNSALLKNMNLLLNVYDHSGDPTAALWQKTAVFYDPKIYPSLTTDTNIVLMEKDICSLRYVFHDHLYYLQSDLSWRKDASATAMRILFMDKYPQFYELANNIQTESNFVLKVFAQPQILSIGPDGRLGMFSSLTASTDLMDLFMRIDHQQQSSLHLPVLTFSTPFQIVTKNEASFLGPVSDTPDTLVIGALPMSSEFPGYFMVSRLDIQPNIFQVAKTLPARLAFLQDSVLPSPASPWRWSMLLLLIALVLLLLAIIIRDGK